MVLYLKRIKNKDKKLTTISRLIPRIIRNTYLKRNALSINTYTTKKNIKITSPIYASHPPTKNIMREKNTPLQTHSYFNILFKPRVIKTIFITSLILSNDIRKRIKNNNLIKRIDFPIINCPHKTIQMVQLEICTKENLGKGLFGNVYQSSKNPAHAVKTVSFFSPFESIPIQGIYNQFISSNLGFSPKIHSLIQAKDGYLIVMTKISGDTLFQFTRKKELSLKQKLEICLTLTIQIQNLHTLKIYHNDLTDQNIMIQSQSKKPIIIDFDFSKSKQQGLIKSTLFNSRDEHRLLEIFYYLFTDYHYTFQSLDKLRLSEEALCKRFIETSEKNNQNIPKETIELLSKVIGQLYLHEPNALEKSIDTFRYLLKTL